MSTQLAATIRTQESALREVLDLPIEDVLDGIEAAERVWLVGTGTSQHAAELGAQMLRLAGIDARWESAAGFARGRAAAGPRDAVILITHTGQTAFARTVRRRALDAGLPLLSVTGSGVGWPEALEVAPRERSETHTVSYTATLVALARIAGVLGAVEFTAPALTATVDAVAAAAERSWHGTTRPGRLLVIAGVGPAAVTAREGALKAREAARLVSQGFEAEYLLHGSAVPLGPDDRLLLLQPEDDPDGLLSALGSAARAEGVGVVSVAEPVPLAPLLLQIPLTVRLQTLASWLADEGGHDPDTVITGAWAADRLWTRGAPD